VALDVRSDPTKIYVLVFALMALFGVTASLFVRRRRVWFRAVPADDRAGGPTVVSIGGLSRSEDTQLAAEVRSLLMSAVPDRVEESPATNPSKARTPGPTSDKPAEDAGEGV